MGKIVLLDEHTINKIAAGEVIERPASVVKEMVENSIDAGAKNITIEIKNGGISLIRITDDGSGIAEDDMKIAFERHATSKIRSAEDLKNVKTMGFRGEALASIAEVAKVEMISKTAYDTVGNKLVVEGGKVIEKSEVATVTGTRITVQNLFYNTPVRYKFLKKDYTEAGYIEDVVTRIALVNRGIAIKLINNDKVLLQTTGSFNIKNIIYSIYGKDVANGIKEVEYTFKDMKVSGVIGLPEIARSNRANELFFVNGRFVRDKNLTAGTDKAYENLIPSGRYPFVILNLEMNPSEVDVNVHPAKLEVRFQDEANVFKTIFHAIKDNLDGVNAVSADVFENKKMDENISTQAQEKEDIFDVMSENKVGENVSRFQENVQAAEMQFSKLQQENQEEKNKKIEENKEQMEKQLNQQLKELEEEKTDDKEEKKGLAKFFKKFIKEKEDESEENNAILEIFKESRLKEGLSKPLEFAIDNTELKHESFNEVVNEDIIEKEVKIEETLVSSNTRELDFDVMDALKDKTLIMDSIAKMEKQETVAIPSTKETISQETQTIPNVNNVCDEVNVKLPNDVQKIEEENVQELKIEENDGTFNEDEKLDEASVPTLDAVEKMTSKILEMKLKNLESTQMIDTVKVREAVLENQKITPEFANMYKKTFGLDANEIRKERALEEKEKEKINVSNEFVNAENTSLFSDENKTQINYKFVGVAFENYIIIELKNEMYIIDVMSARERINFEKVKYSYFSNQKSSTTLLLPDIITCDLKEMSVAKENKQLFEKAGFEFEEFGEKTLKLTAVPIMCEELNTKNLFLSILNEIENVAVTDLEEKEKKFIRAIAINSTVKQHISFEEKEIDSLIKDLLSIENPFSDEHGRFTAIKMSKSDIEKKFARRK